MHIIFRCARPCDCSCKGKASAWNWEIPTFAEWQTIVSDVIHICALHILTWSVLTPFLVNLVFGVMESQPISKKSHLTVQGAQSFWIANLLWQQCPTSYTHVAMSTGRLTFKCPDTYLRPYTPLWDVGVSQIFCPTLCATRRDLNLFLVVPCSPLLWLHNSVQASLNPSLTVNTLNFLLPTALSKHLFSIKPVTNIKVYCEQINLNIPTMAYDLPWKKTKVMKSKK